MSLTEAIFGTIAPIFQTQAVFVLLEQVSIRTFTRWLVFRILAYSIIVYSSYSLIPESENVFSGLQRNDAFRRNEIMHVTTCDTSTNIPKHLKVNERVDISKGRNQSHPSCGSR